jgi:sensor histidine kinase YesM
VSLREELSFLDRYIEIMRVRFGDRLQIDLTVGADVMDAMVPSLVLQPIVENAIRHGMTSRAERGHVAIRATRSGAVLTLEVSDDGPGLPKTPPTGSGIGLANTRERLARLYGSAGRVEIVDGEGLTVRLTIPLR